MVVGDLASLLTVVAGFSYRPFILAWVIVSVAASLLVGRAMSAGSRSTRVKRARRGHVPPDLRTR